MVICHDKVWLHMSFGSWLARIAIPITISLALSRALSFPWHPIGVALLMLTDFIIRPDLSIVRLVL